MKKICFITAVHGSAYSFLRDHMSALKKEYQVHYICNEPDVTNIKVPNDAYHFVNIQRQVSVVNDLKALWHLYKYFRKEKFDAVHSVTPKAGILTAVASFLARVPNRIHTYTGQVWANKTGMMRFILKSMDKLIALFDNHLLVDGEGQRQFLIKNKVLKETNSCVLGSGSICGVNLERFNPSDALRNEKRNELGISEDKIVFAFMGRLNRDKGLHELLAAFNRLASERDDVYLLIFGSDEENISDTFQNYSSIRDNINFKYYGRTPEPFNMLQAGDVFVLPTYREGFGSSVIEASALGLPVICSDAYGVMDAMIDNETGLRCKVGDVDSLYNSMLKLSIDNDLRSILGKNGRERVVKEFDGRYVTQCWVEFYHKSL